MSATLPVVDLSRTRLPGSDRNRAVNEIREACLVSGFFNVINHGIDADVVAQAFAMSRAFFHLSPDVKNQVALQSGQARGYMPMRFQTLDANAAPDLKESFHLGRDATFEDQRLNPGDPEFMPNRWPALDGFRPAMLRYHERAFDLALHLLGLLALSLDLPEDALEQSHRETIPMLRLLHYPPHPKDAPLDNFGAGAHTDWGCLTILAQDDAGGLEVLDPSGRWNSATPIPGAFVVNLGDLLMRWTNGKYRSTVHRVINAVNQRDRYSMAFFVSPHSSTRIECIPSCMVPGELPAFAPCTAAEHINEQRRRSLRAAGRATP